MGQAAVPIIMLATTAVSVGVSVHQSRQQSALLNQQAEAEGNALEFQAAQTTNQLNAAAKEDEITRLRQMRATLSNNILTSVASGTTVEGSTGAIIEGNIDAAREDISIIQGNTEAAIAGVEAGAAMRSSAAIEGTKAQRKALNANLFGNIANSGASLAGGLATGDNWADLNSAWA